MQYEIFGPFKLPRDYRGFILMDSCIQKDFWDEVGERFPGLGSACGCYVFAKRAAKGGLPWYVGKAEHTSFQQECFTADKIIKYNSALGLAGRGTPIIYFYARITTTRVRFAKPSVNGSRDIDYLEKMLIGFALDRNADLINIRETSLLRNMVVPGLLNNPPGRLPASAADVRSVMGY